MKTIGIKLADGSFYPVLNEGEPNERLLELTTAHNNQTKVMVDLYRSEIGSMEDAEYVDSLQIENLIEHPNGEPTLTFTVSIDENKKLSARMVDNETGLQSNATITLVSRTLEERLLPDEYDIKDPTLSGVSLTQTEENSLFGTDDNAEENPDNPLVDFSFETEPNPSFDVVNEYETPVEETSVTEEDIKLPEASDFNPLDEPILEEDALNIDEFNTEGEGEYLTEETEKAEESSGEEVAEAETPENNNSLDRDFTFDIPEDNSQNSEVEAEATDETQSSTDFVSDLPEFDFSTSTGDLDLTESETKNDDLDLDLPDFDAIQDTSSEETSFSDNEFDLSDLDSLTPSQPEPDDNSYLEDLDFDDLDTGTQNSKSGTKPISFTGLYDKETELGNSASLEGENHNTKPAVIICILCAVICILATLFVLMVIPSKFNLFGNKKSSANQTEAKTEISVTELPAEKGAPAQSFKEFDSEPLPEPEPISAPEPLPPVPEAKEEEVVIIENAEDVVPLPPPVTPVKPKDINYKIKWGDTLWDISDTYYKNPWRYKYIARYNGIKNPDYIISGTYITIPAE